MFNAHSAVWIVHSIPHYPPKISTKSYHINEPQTFYGQSMLCVTVNYETIETIGEQLLYNYPQIYDYFVPDGLLSGSNKFILNNLMNVIQGQHVQQAPWFNLNSIQTLNKGYNFLSFAKFTNFHDDLYTALVAPKFQSNLKTETWNNGAGTLPSNCTLNYHVYNIEQVNFEFLNMTFSVHHDHSKWAITAPMFDMNLKSIENSTILCVGDINRQIEQYVRAGGTLCLLNNLNVWSKFNNIIQNYETCNPADENIFLYF